MVEGNNSGLTSNLKFLNSPGGRAIKFESTNPLDIPFVEVYYYESESNTVFQQYLYPNQIINVPIGQNKIYLKPYSTAGPILTPDNFIIDFVDFDFDITSNTGEPPCLTFDNLNVNLTTNLDGLCDAKIAIKLPSNTVNTWGLDSNFYKEINANSIYNYQIPISEEFCQQSCTNGSSIVGCCMNFDFEITLRPCWFTGEECPPISFTKQYTICCFCGGIDPEQ